MAKDKQLDPRSVARAKRIHEQIEQLRKKPAGRGSSPGPQATEPGNLRDIIHDRMDKLDKKKGC